MCFGSSAVDRQLVPSRSRSRMLVERAINQNRPERAAKELLQRKCVPIPRPMVDALTRHVENVSERFAHLLHMTLSLAFDDVAPSGAPAVVINGLPTAEYVASIDYRRIVQSLLRFKCAHPQDLTSLFALILVYLRQMKARSALPLLEQMIVWFDVPNVVYCITFLAHVWLLDDPLPLADWHAVAEGVVKGVNLNKCVRNCLRILKYRLFVNQTQSRAALLTLEYTEKSVEHPRDDVLLMAKSRPVREEPERPLGIAQLRRDSGAPSMRYADIARQRMARAQGENRSRAPFAPPRRA